MKSIVGKFRLLGVLFFVFTSVVAYGQKADDYYNEGKVLKAKKMYQDAISKFSSARSLYVVAKKQSMISSCNLEISECKKLIGRRKTVVNPGKNDKKVEEKENVVKPEPEVKAHKDVTLSLSEERLDFDCKPKDGATQSVEVNCNYDDWEANTDKDWITIYTADKKFSVEVAENTSEEERSAVVKVTCGDKSVDLVVNQSKSTQLRKIKDAFGGLFKKKKK